MKLLIAGTAHDLGDVLNGAKLADLLELKVQTGIGMRTLTESLKRMGQYERPSDVIDDEVVLRALIALVWLCRRRAGEQVTVAEAGELDLTDLVFELEAAPEAEDPTSAPTDSDRGDGHQPEAQPTES